MALTAISVNGLAAPKGPIATLAVGTGATQGFTFSLLDTACPAKVLNITGDADLFWSHLDGTAAVGSMCRLRADQPLRIQVHTPVSIYLRTATGTSNVWVTVEL